MTGTTITNPSISREAAARFVAVARAAADEIGVAYRLSTHTWSTVIQDPAVAQLAHIPRLVAVGGGFPIIENGAVIGGLGLSGGNADQDRRAAEKALSSLGFDLPD